jgi:HEAT repeat protein
LTAALADENPTVRRTTAEALGAYGPAAQSAVPRLISALGDKDEGIADQARLTLSKVGEGSVRHLVGALNHRNGEIRIGAVRTLATIGPAAQAAGPALLALLDADDGPLRATAAWALGKIHWLKAVPRLLSAIESSDRKLRDSAKSALSRMGAAAVPGLIDKLGHDDEGVRLRVVDALGAIGPAARDALPALREVMGPEPKVNYRWAIERIEGKRKTP